MKRRILLSILLVVFLLLPIVGMAQGLNIVGHYSGAGGAVFDIATYTKDNDTIGLVGIGRKVSITFRKDEWPSFVAIWRKAKQTQSDSFQFVGTYKETGTEYNSLLTVAAGPGVQFTINDKPGTFSFVLLPGDFARFDADVAKVGDSLGPN